MTRKDEMSIDEAFRVFEQSTDLLPHIKKYLDETRKTVKRGHAFNEKVLQRILRQKEKRLALLATAHRRENGEWDDRTAEVKFARTAKSAGFLAAEINHLRRRRGVRTTRGVRIPYKDN